MQFKARTKASEGSQSSWRLTLALCAVMLAALIATAVLTEQSLSRLTEARKVGAHTLQVDKALKDLLSEMLDAETGQRGFLLSGRAIYLQPYYVALTRLRETRASLATALSQTSASPGELGVMDKAIAAKLQELDRTVRLKSEGRSDEAVELMLTGAGKEAMDAVREALQVLESSEDERANQWGIEHAREIRNNYWILVASLALNLLIFVVLVQRMRYAIVQGRAGTEKSGQQIVGEMGVEGDTALDVGAQPDFALDDHQGSGLILGKRGGRHDDIVVSVSSAILRAAGEREIAAKARQSVTDLGLEDHDEGKDAVGQDGADKPVQSAQIGEMRDVEGNGQGAYSGEHGNGTGAADQ